MSIYGPEGTILRNGGNYVTTLDVQVGSKRGHTEDVFLIHDGVKKLKVDEDGVEIIGSLNVTGSITGPSIPGVDPTIPQRITDLETENAAQQIQIDDNTTVNTTQTTDIAGNAQGVTDNSDAIDGLDVRVTDLENGDSGQALQITSLENKTQALIEADSAAERLAVNRNVTMYKDEGDVVGHLGTYDTNNNLELVATRTNADLRLESGNILEMRAPTVRINGQTPDNILRLQTGGNNRLVMDGNETTITTNVTQNTGTFDFNGGAVLVSRTNEATPGGSAAFGVTGGVFIGKKCYASEFLVHPSDEALATETYVDGLTGTLATDLVAVENKADQNATDIDTLETTGAANLVSLNNSIAVVDGKTITNAGDITTNAGNIATNATGITTNAGDITTNAGDITTNAGAITGLDTRVTTLELAGGGSETSSYYGVINGTGIGEYEYYMDADYKLSFLTNDPGSYPTIRLQLLSPRATNCIWLLNQSEVYQGPGSVSRFTPPVTEILVPFLNNSSAEGDMIASDFYPVTDPLLPDAESPEVLLPPKLYTRITRLAPAFGSDRDWALEVTLSNGHLPFGVLAPFFIPPPNPITNTFTYGVTPTGPEVTAIQADGDPPAAANPQDPGLGWYYINSTGPTQKINWYFWPPGQPTPPAPSVYEITTLQAYFVVKIYSTTSWPFISLYTTPQPSGDAGGWYHSRRTYIVNSIFQGVALPGEYVFYIGSDPVTVEPLMTHIPLEIDTFSSNGDDSNDQTILSVAVSTDSSAAANAVEFALKTVYIQAEPTEVTYNLSS